MELKRFHRSSRRPESHTVLVFSVRFNEFVQLIELIVRFDAHQIHAQFAARHERFVKSSLVKSFDVVQFVFVLEMKRTSSLQSVRLHRNENQGGEEIPFGEGHDCRSNVSN